MSISNKNNTKTSNNRLLNLNESIEIKAKRVDSEGFIAVDY